MLAEFVTKILTLGTPNVIEHGSLEYTDKKIDLIVPPAPSAVAVSTLQGLVDLFDGELDDAKKSGDLLVHITGPRSVALISRESDLYGRRRRWVACEYPESIKHFPYHQLDGFGRRK
jgi:hypothetical protein